MNGTRSLSRLALAAPLALALAACSSDVEEGSLEGAPIAEVPAPAGTTWSTTTTVSDDGGYILGNPDAPIKLVEYGSLTCPACANFSVNGAEPLEKEYVDTGRVSYEFRSVILHGPPDLALTALVACGGKDFVHPLSNQVWANLPAIQNGLYADQDAVGRALNLPEDQRFVQMAEVGGLYDFFAARGLSEDQARTCLGDFASLTTIAEKAATAAERDGVQGTPTFMLNGRKLDGVLTWTDLEPLLQRAGAR